MLQWLPFLLIAVPEGFWLWRNYRTRQRRPAVARFASQHGLSYSEVGYVDSPGYDFPLLRTRTSDDSGYNNVLAGQWQGLPVKEADYWYRPSTNLLTDSPGGKGNYQYFSIVVADLAATMPHVSVQAKDMLTRSFEHVGRPPLPTSAPSPRASSASNRRTSTRSSR